MKTFKILKIKLKNKSGESIVESLVGVLIVTICMAALAVAIVTAIRINADIKATDVSFEYSDKEGTSETIVIDDKTHGRTEINVDMYQDKAGNGYYYYNMSASDNVLGDSE